MCGAWVVMAGVPENQQHSEAALRRSIVTKSQQHLPLAHCYSISSQYLTQAPPRQAAAATPLR